MQTKEALQAYKAQAPNPAWGATGKDAKEKRYLKNKQNQTGKKEMHQTRGTACAVIRQRCGEYQENNQ